MALQDVTLPKRYKNGRVLFEQTLDAWRLAAQSGFATVNLNLTQLARDCFSTGYVFDNDGAANLTTSLQDQINDLATGATPITGTTSDSFSINTDGSAAVLTTSALTAIRTFTFPDITGTFVVTEGTQTVNGLKTFVIDNASNTSVTRCLVATHTTSGTAAAGIGTEIALLTENGSGSAILSASIQGVLSTVTNGAEVSYVDLYIKNSGSDYRIFRATTGYTQVGNTSTYEFLIGRTPAANGVGRLYFLNSNTQKNWKISHNDTVTGAFEIAQETASGAETFSTPFFVIGSTGNAGIGTTTPRAKVDVLSTTEQIRQTYTDNSVYASHLVNSSGYYSVISTGLRYGFGTASPATTGHFYAAASTATSLRITADATFDSALQIGSTNGYALVYNSTSDNLTINRDAPLGTGSAVITIKTTGEMLLPAVDPPTANYANRNSLAKAWGTWADSLATFSSSYNVDSITSDDGDGLYYVNVDTDFASVTSPNDWTVSVNATGGTGVDKIGTGYSDTVGRALINIYDVSSAASSDASFGFVFYGAQ